MDTLRVFRCMRWGSVADILAFRPELVPVGEDQIPHLELTREVQRENSTRFTAMSARTLMTKTI